MNRTPLIGDVYKQTNPQPNDRSCVLLLIGIVDTVYLLGDNNSYTIDELNDSTKWTLLKEGEAL